MLALMLALVLASLVTTRLKWGPAATKLVTRAYNELNAGNRTD